MRFSGLKNAFFRAIFKENIFKKPYISAGFACKQLINNNFILRYVKLGARTLAFVGRINSTCVGTYYVDDTLDDIIGNEWRIVCGIFALRISLQQGMIFALFVNTITRKPPTLVVRFFLMLCA